MAQFGDEKKYPLPKGEPYKSPDVVENFYIIGLTPGLYDKGNTYRVKNSDGKLVSVYQPGMNIFRAYVMTKKNNNDEKWLDIRVLARTSDFVYKIEVVDSNFGAKKVYFKSKEGIYYASYASGWKQVPIGNKHTCGGKYGFGKYI